MRNGATPTPRPPAPPPLPPRAPALPLQRPRRRARGHTLLELLTVLVILSVIVSIATPLVLRALDRAAVEEAAQTVGTLHAVARHAAIARHCVSRLTLDPLAKTATVALACRGAGWDTLTARSLGPVRLSVSQRLIAFSPLGLGMGASNSRIVVARGASAETLTVSRSGRLKRW